MFGVKPSSTNLVILKSKFPDHALNIEKLYIENSDFRALSEDYFLCMEFTQKLKSDMVEDRFRLNEFQHLQEELERELLDYIKKRGED